MLIRLSFLLSLCLFFVKLSGQNRPRDFSFLTGSCAYLHPSEGDTSLYLYRGDTSIFYSMSRTPVDFILWLGDNWYLGREEWNSYEGLRYKARYTRKALPMQPLLDRRLPEYAIWDDHDYGPDQGDRYYPLKQESRKVFMETWTGNPGFGEGEEGIYTSFRKEDVQFLLLDDRWFRERDDVWSYLLFKPNPQKQMFGKKQMDWLKSELLKEKTASFKVIVSGSQVLNPWAKGDGLVHYPVEYKELLNFIGDHHIEGVVFLTGDRHFSEIIRLPRKERYPLYDLTVSPLTSSIHRPDGYERKNKFRVPGTLIETHNYCKISFSGAADNRELQAEFFNTAGELLLQWRIARSELRD